MAKTKRRKLLKIFLFSLLAIFVILNAIAAIQAYKLTHYKEGAKPLTTNTQFSTADKVQAAIFGIDVPRPKTKEYPNRAYDSLTIRIDDNNWLDTWVLRTKTAKQGFILLFHGYMDEKSSMLYRAYRLLNMGYDVMLVDFRGGGGSSGSRSTIGYLEAEDVKIAYDHVLHNMREEDIYLLGFSMGAAAVIKAQSDYEMFVKGIIIEAAYGSFYDTVAARLDLYGVPRFPMCHLLVFWGGVENGFNPMDANPQEFAKNITVPALVMCGLKDPYVSQAETQTIFDNLGSSNKKLQFFAKSSHHSYLRKHRKEWISTVSSFLESTVNKDMY